MRKFFRITLFLLVFVLAMTGCAAEKASVRPSAPPAPSEPASGGVGGVGAFPMLKIDPETAMEMMKVDDGHVIVDVRRQDEYDAGHIPGAILIPNETIGSHPPEELPDLHQVILIYCRSGNRSNQAAKKLSAMGYENVYDFGGINTWPGELVTEEP